MKEEPMRPFDARDRLCSDDWDIISIVLGDAGGALLGVSLLDGTGSGVSLLDGTGSWITTLEWSE